MSDVERLISFGAVIEVRPARLMFRVVPGDRVRVELRTPESFDVLRHARVRIEPTASADGPSSSL
jgi:hypothetical protein